MSITNQARPTAQYGTVEAIERLSPSMIRIVFGGNRLAGFTPIEATHPRPESRPEPFATSPTILR